MLRVTFFWQTLWNHCFNTKGVETFGVAWNFNSKPQIQRSTIQIKIQNPDPKIQYPEYKIKIPNSLMNVVKDELSDND